MGGRAASKRRIELRSLFEQWTRGPKKTLRLRENAIDRVIDGKLSTDLVLGANGG